MSSRAATFDRLQKAPAGVFMQVTPPETKEASQQPEIKPESQNMSHTGTVSEADALEGAKAAEIAPFSTGTDATASLSTDASKSPGSNAQSLGGLLTAKTTIGIVDSILPAIAVIAMQYFLGLKMNKRELQLNENERAILTPVLQNYLNSISVNFDSPLNALLITVGAIYGSKFAEKGFTAYFDKRDTANAEKERLDKLKKELEPKQTAPPKVNLNELKVVQQDEPETEYTDEQIKRARIQSGKKFVSRPLIIDWMKKNNFK